MGIQWVAVASWVLHGMAGNRIVVKIFIEHLCM